MDPSGGPPQGPSPEDSDGEGRPSVQTLCPSVPESAAPSLLGPGPPPALASLEMVPQYTGQLSQDIRRRFSGDKFHRSDCNFREPSAPISARGGRCARQVPPSLDEPPKEGPAPLKVTQGSHGPRVSRCRSTPHGCEFSALPHSWERETGGSWATPRPSGGGVLHLGVPRGAQAHTQGRGPAFPTN